MNINTCFDDSKYNMNVLIFTTSINVYGQLFQKDVGRVKFMAKSLWS